MRFEWDASKSECNRARHGMDFAEVCEVFESGEDFLEILDESHSTDEERFIAIGPIRRGLVVVVWTERTDEAIRIISARWATSSEKRLFQEYMRSSHE